MAMSVAVIIPAHNEQVALPRCLAALAAQDYRGPVEVVIAANGCTDDTARVANDARSCLPPRWRLSVLQLPVAAKWDALNAADAMTSADVRVFLDADIILSSCAISDLVDTLASPEPRLAQPKIIVGEPDGTRFVHSFTRFWSSLPYVQDQVLGVGCYAVNRPGRRLWGTFPPWGADDTYVRLRFADDRKIVLRKGTMKLCFPSSLRELVLVRARWCRLSRQIRRNEQSLPRSERRRWLSAARFLLAHSELWFDGLVFSGIWICATAISHLPSTGHRWSRAESAKIRGDKPETITTASR
jgi:glycosyltransferase involved in cell wall biosynthesis